MKEDFDNLTFKKLLRLGALQKIPYLKKINTLYKFHNTMKGEIAFSLRQEFNYQKNLSVLQIKIWQNYGITQTQIKEHISEILEWLFPIRGYRQNLAVEFTPTNGLQPCVKELSQYGFFKAALELLK